MTLWIPMMRVPAKGHRIRWRLPTVPARYLRIGLYGTIAVVFVLLVRPRLGSAPPVCHRPGPMPNQTFFISVHNASLGSLILLEPSLPISNISILNLVTCGHGNKKARDEIRETWMGASKCVKSGMCRVVFLLGTKEGTVPEIAEEHETHGDILLVNVDDTYNNLVYKLLAGYRWATTQTTDFVLKSDSDVVIHMDRFQSLLYGPAPSLHPVWTSHGLHCHTQFEPPVRDKCSRWYTPREVYPRDVFPRYCSGPAYFARRRVFAELVGESRRHRVLEVEDVFYTGVVAESLGISRNCDRYIVPFSSHDRSHCDANGKPSLSFYCQHHVNISIPELWKRLETVSCLHWYEEAIESVRALLRCP